jgi:Kef-type K+ transport system membrane component KefB
MPSFENLLIVVAVAFAAPFVLGLLPSVRLPSVVLEIVVGIVVGPSVLGIAEVDEAVEVVALVGLTFVLFLAGLEIELEKLRGPLLRLTSLAFALSFGIALVVSLGLSAGGLVETPLLVAIILCSTSLGVLVPVLKDAGEISSMFGQLVIAAASIADFGAIILLSLFFSGGRSASAPTCCACRTPPRRSGSARRSCCSSASPRWPRSSGSRRSSARSSRERCSRSSTATGR